MAAAGLTLSAAGLPSSLLCHTTSSSRKSRTTRVPLPTRCRLSALEKKKLGRETTPPENARASSLRDYFERSKDLIRSDGGPPRWFSPVECGPQRFQNSPLLLFLPGVDGVGLGLILHQQRLGEIFNVWCLHIPVKDRTSFVDLVTLVERTIRSQNSHSPDQPIYLVGECLGGCLALAVAARNPDIDLVLVLANPGTSFSNSPLEPLVPLLEIMPDELYHRLLHTLSLAAGDPLRMAMSSLVRGLSLQQTVEDLSQGLVELPSYFSAMVEILPRETFLWKLQMLKSASAFANSRLHAVTAQTLILTSGKDQFLPSHEEGDRLSCVLQKCVIRTFNDSGHFLYLEEGVDLVTVIKGPNFYRRGKHLDYVSDYVPSTPDEFKQIYEPYRWFETATSPVWLSTLENGEIVRGLAGIPSEGPVLLVGYHMLLGLELVPMVSRFITEKNINVRGIAHPMMFKKLKDGSLPELTVYDTIRALGAVPVSANNFFKLFSSNSHVLLYPGGMREALHRKGEQYKLFWPEQSEFVRMAARFGAKIIPFGVVGEDDVGELLFDYNDLMKIPYFKSQIQELTNDAQKLRVDAHGELANQDVHLPGVFPKLPGRFYFLFGKPIETEDPRNKEKCHGLYLQVKSEVESSIAYLKEKREKDPYRNILPRLLYQARHGFTSEVPTFEL